MGCSNEVLISDTAVTHNVQRYMLQPVRAVPSLSGSCVNMQRLEVIILFSLGLHATSAEGASSHVEESPWRYIVLVGQVSEANFILSTCISASHQAGPVPAYSANTYFNSRAFESQY